MKAVILAAGRGSRIASVTGGLPKCLLTFGDRTFLDFQIDSLFRLGVSDVAIIVGHERERIRAHVKQCHPEQRHRITFVDNERYDSTNNMYSLWLARNWLDGARFVCLNADVVCHPDILGRALEMRTDIALVIDRRFREETTKVIIEHDCVLLLDKQIDRPDAGGTFVGIATFSRRGAEALFAHAEALFARGQVSHFFNDVISQLAAEGVPVHFTETGDLQWAEVDDPDDLLFAQTEVWPQLEPLALSAGRATD